VPRLYREEHFYIPLYGQQPLGHTPITKAEGRMGSCLVAPHDLCRIAYMHSAPQPFPQQEELAWVWEPAERTSLYPK